MLANKEFQLSEGQVNFFNLFGYLVLPGLFSADEMVDITREFESTFAAGGKDVIEWKHQAHHGYKRRVLPQFIDRSAKLSASISASAPPCSARNLPASRPNK